MSKKNGLGRSFDSLIPSDLLDESFDPTAAQDGQVSDLRIIKISELSVDPEQPRKHFEEAGMDELSQSIAEHGIIQPLVVTPKNGGYMIVAGERRFRAAKTAGLTKIPVIIRTLNNQHKLELSIIENVQRRDLTAIEVATAYAKLRDQFNLSMDEIGKRVGGKSASAVSNTLRLLRLPKLAKEAIAEGKLTEGQARPMVGLDEKSMKQLLPRVVSEGWSARQVESSVSSIKNNSRKLPPKDKPAFEADTSELENVLSTTVRAKVTPKGSGQLMIHFKDKKEYEDLVKKIKSTS